MKKLLLILLIYLMYSCAVMEAPSGGPKDTTPPTISEYYPKNYTTNYNDDYLSIQFDKYMNKSSVIENFSISPKLKYDFYWSGKKLKIKFDEEMEPDVTYVVKLKANYSDYKGNKPEDALTFIFTKGSKIDSGRVSGKLIDAKPEGKSIFAWRDKDTPIDIATEPDYTVSLGSSGEFELIGLKKGLYRIVAVDDKMKNEMYESGIDGFGAAQFDVEVFDEINPYINLKIAPPFDRKGVSLVNAFPIANNVLQIGLSEDVYLDSINLDNFKLMDSVSNNNIEIKSIFSVDEIQSKKLFAITENLDTNKIFKFEINNIKDTLGNNQNDSLTFSFFGGISKEFKNKLNLMPKKIDSKIKDNKLNFIFSHSIAEVKDSAITIINKKDSNNLEFNYKINFNKLNITFICQKDEEDLILKINLNKIIDFKNESGIDSIFTYNFKYLKNKSESKIIGNVVDSTNCVGDILLILTQNNKLIDKQKLNSDGGFTFSNLEEGNYQLEIICDENQNNKYDFGNDIPFFHSEFFYIYDKELKVKENWDINDVKIILKQKNEYELK